MRFDRLRHFDGAGGPFITVFFADEFDFFVIARIL